MEFDDRPWGWGICASCGEDCEDEADYDEVRRVSTCPSCRERQRLSDEERHVVEVFVRR